MFAVWGGISGAQTTLPLMLTHGPAHGVGARARRRAGGRARPRARLGLARQGRLEPGADADIAIVRTGEAWTLEPADLEYRHRHSPFVGAAPDARGWCARSCADVTVCGEGADPGAPAAGRLVTRRGGRPVSGPHARTTRPPRPRADRPRDATSRGRCPAGAAPSTCCWWPPRWAPASHGAGRDGRRARSPARRRPGRAGGLRPRGRLTLEAGGRAHDLGPGGFAYLPPGEPHALTPAAGARVCVIDKPYVALPGAPRGPAAWWATPPSSPPVPFLGDPSAAGDAAAARRPRPRPRPQPDDLRPGRVPAVRRDARHGARPARAGGDAWSTASATPGTRSAPATRSGWAPSAPSGAAPTAPGPATYLIYKDWNRDAGGVTARRDGRRPPGGRDRGARADLRQRLPVGHAGALHRDRPARPRLADGAHGGGRPGGARGRRRQRLRPLGGRGPGRPRRWPPAPTSTPSPTPGASTASWACSAASRRSARCGPPGVRPRRSDRADHVHRRGAHPLRLRLPRQPGPGRGR